MKNRNLLVLFSLFVAFESNSWSQEFLFPLYGNPELSRNSSSNAMLRVSAINDTLTLPFEDDFSRPGMYPFDSLWLDSGVYINNNYTALPITIGIATFDGLNQFGSPYHPSSSQDSIADVLTSRPLDLGVIAPGDTTVWFSFYFQPQGLGDIPETEDSLVLQFKDSGEVWNTVWETKGRGDTDFARITLPVLETKYFFKGFQFRFYNIATVNGNRDHWNIDFVRLKKNSSPTDSISDNALLRPLGSLLTEFSSMPYPHYKALSSQLAAMKTTWEDTITNIKYGNPGTSYTAQAEITQNGNPLFTASGFFSTPVQNVLVPFSFPLNSFTYPIQSTDSAEFLVKSFFSQSGVASNSFNDTSYYIQKFYNYYSYDDGSAELSYGLTGSQNVSLALKYDVKIQDTLRGIEIYFNPTGENVANKLFQLVIWQYIDEVSNQDSVLYRMINQKPDTFDGINAFKTYLLDTLLLVGPGTVWIGVIQNDPQVLFGYGFDKNTDAHDKVLYRVTGDWLNSSINGTLMMRPLFGRTISAISVYEMENPEFPFSVFPNPAEEKVRLQFDDTNGNQFRFELMDCLGNVILKNKIVDSEEIDISPMSSGFYFLRLINTTKNMSSVRKLIVQ